MMRATFREIPSRKFAKKSKHPWLKMVNTFHNLCTIDPKLCWIYGHGWISLIFFFKCIARVIHHIFVVALSIRFQFIQYSWLAWYGECCLVSPAAREESGHNTRRVRVREKCGENYKEEKKRRRERRRVKGATRRFQCKWVLIARLQRFGNISSGLSAHSISHDRLQM